MRRAFRERNPVPIGVIGVAVAAALLIASFNIEKLPLVGSGNVYHAAFSEAAGLRPGNSVRVAGVKVGQVRAVELDGAHVRVDFRVEREVTLGSRTEASIEIETVLGDKFLALSPAGPGELSTSDQIPVERTRSPYDVLEALGGLTRTVDQIDTVRLAKAFDTLSTTFADTPPEVRGTLRGLTRLSKTISERDAKLRQLLNRAEGVTKVLADRNKEFTKLLRDGDLLLREVERRREIIHQLLVNTVRLSEQLRALVRENEQQLKPALARLDQVVDILLRNQRNLRRSIQLLEPFVEEFTDTLGSGPWFDNYIQNFIPVPPSVQLPSATGNGKGGER